MLSDGRIGSYSEWNPDSDKKKAARKGSLFYERISFYLFHDHLFADGLCAGGEGEKVHAGCER